MNSDLLDLYEETRQAGHTLVAQVSVNWIFEPREGAPVGLAELTFRVREEESSGQLMDRLQWKARINTESQSLEEIAQDPRWVGAISLAKAEKISSREDGCESNLEEDLDTRRPNRNRE